MSTTPNPNPTPVDPDLSANWVDPTPVEPLNPATADVLPPTEPVDVTPEPAPLGTEDAAPLGSEDAAAAGAKAGRKASEATAALRESDLKAIYAAAGATQVLVGAVRETVTETSRWANARLSELRFRRAELAKQAEDMRRRAEGLPEDVKAVPDVAKTRVADLQQQATGTYSDLATRGQRVLHDVRSDVVNRIDPAFDRLQERLEAARRAIRGAAVSAPTPPAPVAEPAVPTPAAPVGESPAPVMDDPDVHDAVLVEEVVIEPTGQDTTQER
jgi:hypothetical protein